MNIQPIVEGHGEIEAVPILLRRLRDLAQAYPLEVNAPIRRHVSDFFDEAQIRKAIRLAIKQNCQAIMLIVDGDAEGDCPRNQAPEILGWRRLRQRELPVRWSWLTGNTKPGFWQASNRFAGYEVFAATRHLIHSRKFPLAPRDTLKCEWKKAEAITKQLTNQRCQRPST